MRRRKGKEGGRFCTRTCSGVCLHDGETQLARLPHVCAGGAAGSGTSRPQGPCPQNKKKSPRHGILTCENVSEASCFAQCPAPSPRAARVTSLPVTVLPMDHELQRWCLVPSGAHDWGQHALRVRHTWGFAGPAAGRPHERSGRGWSREKGGRGSDDAGLVPGAAASVKSGLRPQRGTLKRCVPGSHSRSCCWAAGRRPATERSPNEPYFA